MTKREQILAAIKATLVNVPGVLPENIFRSRVEPCTRGRAPAISVEPVADSPSQNVVPYLDWSLTVRVSIIVRGDVPDQVADPIIQDVHAKIMADTSLGGLSMDLEPSGVSYEILEGDQPIGIVSLDYRVQYRTSLTDLSL